ncbi:MAG: Na+/H+ antiporter subunit E [Microthrixaceae bacterium]
MTRLLTVAWLTFVWVMLWGSPSPANLVGGVAVAACVTWGFPIARSGRPDIHPIAIARFGLWFAGALVVATCRVATLAVTPRLRLDQSVVPVQLRATSVLVTAFVANSISLTPGTLTVEVVPDDESDGVGPRALLIHSLDTSDAAAVQRDCAAIESLVVAAFGTDDDRRRVADAAPAGEDRAG